jgi:putative DNA primase/helicase
MTPPIALVDTQLERMLVASLIQTPERHVDCGTLGVADFGDFQSAQVYAALANLRDASEWVTPETIAAELQRRHDARGPHRAGDETLLPHDLLWLTAIIQTSLPPDPPIGTWAAQIAVIAEARRAALSEVFDTEDVPVKRTPRGPRAKNTEPVRLAEAFRAYQYELAGEPTLVRWARAWWRYDGTRYVEHDDELLDRDLIGFLDIVVAPQQVRDPVTKVVTVETKRVTSRRSTLGEVTRALTLTMPTLSGGAPQWTEPAEGDPPIATTVACGNGLLDVAAGSLTSPTPRFFTTTALGTRWDPDAPEPVAWLSFLHSLWGDDTESIRALQQMFGYLLTADTSQQKLFALIGPPRSGKGTIARVLKALLGDEAVVNPTLQSLERPFGLAPLVGRTLAIIGDARLGGPTDQAQVVERLLSVSGEDSLSIDRKNRDPINVRLSCRVLLLSNELPRLYDTSGALASRFVILCLSRSFLGAEDIGLEAKLLAELPGILRWAVAGHADLQENGRFVVPLASEQAFAHLREISSPHSVFFEETCEFEPAARTDVNDLYARYRTWCEASGREPENKQMFGRNLHTLFPEIQCRQYRPPQGGSVRRAYFGLKVIN